MQDFTSAKPSITGVVLAGGEARRMGGQDKGLIKVLNKPLIEYVLETLTPQVGDIMINANRNREIYAAYGYPVIADDYEGFCGPLAGMASALRVIPGKLMVTVPCDSPFLPHDLVERLYRQLVNEDADISVAHNGERMQPVFAMFKKELLPSLDDYLRSGNRKIDRWFTQHNFTQVDFSDVPDAFENINTPDEVTAMETSLED